VRPVETVVGDAAAGLAAVFGVAATDVLVELSAGADVVVVSGAAVVVLVSAAATGSSPLFPSPFPPQAPTRIRATRVAAIFLVPMSRRA
jgi:hypothetical protein